MMDLSDVFAIDCSEPQTVPNASSMYANAGMACSAVAPLTKQAKKRPTPGLVKSPKRVYIVTDRALCGGNIIARDMLGDLRYWLEPDENGEIRSDIKKDGFQWVSRSLTYWEQHLGCSRQEARTGVSALVKSGAVEIREFHWNGNETSHYRLISEVSGVKLNACVATNTPCVASNTPPQKEGATYAASNTPSTNEQTPACVASNIGCVATNTGCVASNTPITESLSKDKQKDKYPANGKSPFAKAHAKAQPQTPAKEKQPENQGSSPKSTKKEKSEESKSKPAPLKAVEKKSAPNPWPESMNGKPMTPASEWKSDMQVWGGMEWTETDSSNVLELAASVKAAGHDPLHGIQCAVFNWDILVKREGPESDIPALPETTWARNHPDSLIKLLRDRIATKGPMTWTDPDTVPPKSPPPAAVKTPPPKEDTPTQADVDAAMAQIYGNKP